MSRYGIRSGSSDLRPLSYPAGQADQSCVRRREARSDRRLFDGMERQLVDVAQEAVERDR